jgi:hypothetical protein
MVFPAALRPEQVSLIDIPVALSRKARFSGMTGILEVLDLPDGVVPTEEDMLELLEGVSGYSVAQHTVIGSRLIAPPFALAFLIHEFSETYLPDIPKPLKSLVRVLTAGPESPTIAWEELESQHADVMCGALGLMHVRPLIDSPEVKEMDLAMLALEKRDLMGVEPAPWGLPVPPPANFEGRLEPWPEENVARVWLRRFRELTRQAP